MLDLFVNLLEKLLDVLPNSPVAGLLKDVVKLTDKLLGWVNWFIPFDFAAKAMGVWLVAMGTYYCYRFNKEVINKLK